MWNGDYGFLLDNLIQKDFKIRYRNMSLGIFWSLLNPLVTMGVLTFVFTKLLDSGQPNFPTFVLCGLIPFNFFALAWGTATSSLVDNTQIIKKMTVPREIIPISTVLANCLHFLIQIALLLAITLLSGLKINGHWVWLPLVWALEIVFVCGLSLMTSAINIYVRDTRYVVESFNAVLFWMVPIFYSFKKIPEEFKEVYTLNPMAAIVMAQRNILMDAVTPAWTLLTKLALVSFLMLGIGLIVFHRLKRNFYDYL